MKTLGFIGGGRITRILLNGFKNAQVSFQQIHVYETNETVANNLKSDFPQIETSCTDPSEAASSGWVFIALHPPVLVDALQSIKGHIRKDAMVISLAPKITLDKIRSIIQGVPNLARMNPNAGTFVNKGYNPICFAGEADEKILKDFTDTLEQLGDVPVVPENQMEAYAMVSAMGHTYFWYQLQELKELGISYGLSEEEANTTLSAMLRGTAETLFNSGMSYEQVVDLVPVKPMAAYENDIKDLYRTSLNGLYHKIKP